MRKNKSFMVAAIMLSLTLLMSGCSNADRTDTTDSEISATEDTVVSDDDGAHASLNSVSLTTGDYSDADLDDTYDATNATKITCDDEDIEIDGSGASAEGQIVTIAKEGTYILSGTLSNGQVIVDATEKNVQLVLDNMQIVSESSSAVVVQNAKNTYITLADNSKNYIEDALEYTSLDADDEPSAAIFSKDDLTFNGKGSLEVVANYNNAIQSKDDLKFISGNYTITAVDDAIVGKDSVSILDGTYTIEAQSDVIKATNTDEADKGYVMIDGGDFTITAENDGIQAETLLYINNGTFDITTGGGYENGVTTSGDGDMMPGNGMRGGMRGDMPREDRQIPEDAPNMEEPATPPDQGEMQQPPIEPSNAPDNSANNTTDDTTDETRSSSFKGLKSYVDLNIENGTFNINSADDAIHSNNHVTINDGTFVIQAGDDGMHADQNLTITNGTIDIQQSYEGIEGCSITIDGGITTLIASDDGVNSVNGNDENSGGMGGMDADDGSTITINGGSLKVTASGDGMDANGSISMNGGNVEIQGPTNGGNGSFDYNGTFTLNGGTLFACGSSQMAQGPTDGSAQGFLMTNVNGNVTAGTVITVKNQSDDEIVSYTAEVDSQWICISDSSIDAGEAYVLEVNGSQIDVTAK